VYVRYKLVETISGHEGRSLHRLNMAGLCLGIVTATGLSMVANFQVGYATVTGLLTRVCVDTCVHNFCVAFSCACLELILIIMVHVNAFVMKILMLV